MNRNEYSIWRQINTYAHLPHVLPTSIVTFISLFSFLFFTFLCSWPNNFACIMLLNLYIIYLRMSIRAYNSDWRKNEVIISHVVITFVYIYVYVLYMYSKWVIFVVFFCAFSRTQYAVLRRHYIKIYQKHFIQYRLSKSIPSDKKQYSFSLGKHNNEEKRSREHKKWASNEKRVENIGKMLTIVAIVVGNQMSKVANKASNALRQKILMLFQKNQSDAQ